MTSTHSKKGHEGKGEVLFCSPMSGEMESGKSSPHTGAVLASAGSELLATEGLGKGTFELSGLEVTSVSKKEDLCPLETGILGSYKVAYSYT